jgi:signal transduction histidine kinase
MILLQANSEVLFVIAITVAMLLVIAFFSVYLFFLFQKRKMRLLQQQQQLKEAYEQEILKTQIEIRDQAMNDVGRELHDHINQVMTLIKLNINLLTNKGLAAADENRLGDTKNLVVEVINDIRMLSKTLNGDLVTQVGLVDSISHELDRINRLGIFACTLQVEGEPYDMPADRAFVIFRIVQENLQNVLKHARCRNLVTRLFFSTEKFILIQQDDGTGFDMATTSSTGSGLLNMKRRADMINATLQLTGKPGAGTELVLTIPQSPGKA